MTIQSVRNASAASRFVGVRGARPWPFETEERSALNKLFDSLANTSGSFAGTEVPPYLALAVCGIASGFVVVMMLAFATRLPIALVSSLCVVALAVFVVVGLVRQFITGRESHVVLESVLSALLVIAAISAFVQQSVWTVLDVFTPAIGVFIACSRVGCLLSGCCHGRPSHLGIRYGAPAHDALAGIRLFPIQLVESIWLLGISVVASVIVLLAAGPGVACWFWMLSYAAGRFAIDFARGDVRWRWHGLTEAQWLCIAILVSRIAYEASIVTNISARMWMVFGSAALLVPVSYVTRARWLSLPTAGLTSAMVAELQRFLDLLEGDVIVERTVSELRRTVPNTTTSIGLLIDAAGNGLELHSYNLRESFRRIDEHRAIAFAGMIAQRLPEHTIIRAGFCETGSFHYWALVNPNGQAGSTVADNPGITRLRAQAFAELVRSSVAMGDGGQQQRVDPPIPRGPAPETLQNSGAWYFRRSG